MIEYNNSKLEQELNKNNMFNALKKFFSKKKKDEKEKVTGKSYSTISPRQSNTSISSNVSTDYRSVDSSIESFPIVMISTITDVDTTFRPSDTYSPEKETHSTESTHSHTYSSHSHSYDHTSTSDSISYDSSSTSSYDSSSSFDSSSSSFD